MQCNGTDCTGLSPFGLENILNGAIHLDQSDVHVLTSKTIQKLISVFLSVLALWTGPIKDPLVPFVFVMLFFLLVIFSNLNSCLCSED